MIVLVADDLEINRKLLRSLHAPEGYDVVEAANGMEAFNILQYATGPMVVAGSTGKCPGWRASKSAAGAAPSVARPYT